ncbi:MAG: molecular chaperone TorD family protein [Myxococcota bacterium]|nr:molecular chaperone TorD family protein [Myxococcota bacterium]MDW8363943.1 molecular chaperone TorD family protein [Myxococcales bacterium]
MTGAVREHLERAATHRALAIALAPPRPGLADELEGLAAEAIAPARAGLEALAALATDGNLDAAYHELVGPSGVVRDSESDHDLRGLSNKGAVIADIAGFYRAFGYAPEEEQALPLDHIARELDFVAFLELRSALAIDDGLEEAERVCAAAIDAFVRDHLGRFVRSLLARVARCSAHPFYERLGTEADAILVALYGNRLAPPGREPVTLPVLEPNGCDGPQDVRL